jgi:glutaredoxin
MRKEDNLLTVFTMPSCPNCPKVKKKCEIVAKELGMDLKLIDLSKDFLEGLMHQVMETPSIAFNGETIFFAENPSITQIKKAIKLNKS